MRKWIEGKVTRIDNADAVQTRKPQFPVCRLTEMWTKGADTAEGESDPVGAVEKRGSNHWFRAFIFVHRGGPGVQLRARNTHQATGRVQPHRIFMVRHPIDRIAGQSAAATTKGVNTTILQPAESPIGGGPERTVWLHSEVVHRARA